MGFGSTHSISQIDAYIFHQLKLQNFSNFYKADKTVILWNKRLFKEFSKISPIFMPSKGNETLGSSFKRNL